MNIKTYLPALIFLSVVLNCTQMQAQENDKKLQNVYDKVVEAYDNYDYEALLTYEEEIVPLIENRRDSVKADVYSMLAESYYYMGDLETSLKFYAKELIYWEEEYDQEYHDFEGLYNNLAAVYQEAGKYYKAEFYAKRSAQMAKEKFDKNSPEYVGAIIGLAEIYAVQDNYEFAEKSLKDLINSLPEDEDLYPIARANLADLYSKSGKYTQSEKLFREALDLIEGRIGEASIEYASVLSNLSILYIKTGRFAESEGVLLRAIDILEKSGSEEEPLYAFLLNNLAVTYDKLGLYEEAVDLFNEIREMDREVYGEQHPIYAKTLANLASAYRRLGRSILARKFYDQAIEITKNARGEFNRDYAIHLQEKAILEKRLRNYGNAEQLLMKSLQLEQQMLGEDHPEVATANFHLGNLYLAIENLESAEKYIKRSLQLREKVLGEQHPRFAESTLKMALINWKEENYLEAEKYYSRTFENYFRQIDAYFPVLSEAEKAKFYTTKLKPTFEQFNSYAVARSTRQPGLIGDMYNYQLATKALIMYATNKVRESILNSGDTSLIEKYNRWISNKEQLTQLFSLTKHELEERDIDLDQMMKRTNMMEKELSAASEEFAKTYSKSQVTWNDIREDLREGEAAVEIIRFRKFLPDSAGFFSNEVYYAALIVTEKTKQHPEMVLIGNGSTMETRYLANYRNAIRFKIEEDFSYRIFWEPIAKKLKNIEKVYLSPDGVYNQISINTLRNPAKDQYLVDEIHIQKVTNTKDILSFQQQEKEKEVKQGKAYLIGFPNYNKGVEKDPELLAANQPVKRGSTRGELTRSLRGDGLSRGAMRGSLSRGLRGSLRYIMRGRESIVMLPGTKREVEFIADLYAKENMGYDTLLLNSADENAIKEAENPHTLHIATHGFFIRDVEPVEGEEETGYIENPLLRSGLILAGANQLLSFTPMEVRGEDGILTAYEAMNLNLDQTELVVLSACETGLGQVKNGEGVYGLQRAFLVAGANSLIMSMWSVDDDATQELMTFFYEEWLKTDDKQSSFRKAQQRLKEKYKDPFFWGAFVMVGE